MAWIQTVAPADATGRLRKIYDDAVRRVGRVFKIVEIMSLSPRVLESSLGLYQATMLVRGELSRRRREMLAVVVSRTNDCHY